MTVPAGTALGTYRLLACADDQKKVKESDEGNNCLASTSSVDVGTPDLITTQISGQPATAVPGQQFTLNDTVMNQGTVSAAATKTRYYFSTDAAWSADDVLASGARSVPILAAGASSTGNKQITVPTMAADTYYVLACADDLKKVLESDEGNNCVASTTTIMIGP